MRQPLRTSNRILWATSAVCIVFGGFLSTITLARSEFYPAVLLFSAAMALVAVICQTVVAWRGGAVERFLVIIAMLPAIFIIYDFVRRAVFVFQ